jgi:crotonobetainyl-CoA:carnitine CoA-transferase CaiB-like acyl-CoA transferase
LYAALGPIIATRTTSFWEQFCEDHDIPASAVRTLDELVAELPIAQHPHFGAYREVPPPVRFSATPSSVRRPAPRLGEHGREVLGEVGFTDDEIAALETEGVLRHATAEE